MTRFRWITTGVFVFAVLSGFVFQILIEHLLRTQLPNLLSQASSQSVEVTDIDVHLLDLSVTAERLSMGPQGTALLAEDVVVSLQSAALLQGTIMLESVVAGYVNIDVAALGDSAQSGEEGAGESNAENSEKVAIIRQVLNRWLPVQANLDTMTVFDGERLMSLTEDISWYRNDDLSQRLTWRQAGLAGDLAVTLDSTPIARLLDEQVGNLSLQAVRLAQPDEILTVAIDVKPERDGIAQVISMDTPAVTGVWRFVSEQLLAPPQTSELKLAVLDVGVVTELLNDILAQPGNSVDADFMSSPLPAFSLPNHRVDVQVDKLFFGDQVYSGVLTEITTTTRDAELRSRLELKNLSVESEVADVSGNVTISSGDDWQVVLNLDVRSKEDGGLPGVLGSIWWWEEGTLDFVSTGNSLLELMSHAEGAMDARGRYVADSILPLDLQARFDDERGLLGADELRLQIGQSVLTGEIWTDTSSAELHARLASPFLNLDRLREARGERQRDDVSQDLTMPDLALFPAALPLDITFNGEKVQFGGRIFSGVSVSLVHGPEGGELKAQVQRSDVEADLTIKLQRASNDLILSLDTEVVELPLVNLGLNSPLHLRNGRVQLQGQGKSWPQVFAVMSGTASMQATLPGFDGEMSGSADLQIRGQNRVISQVGLADFQIKAAEAQAKGQLQISLPDLELNGSLDFGNLDLDRFIGAVETTPSDRATPLVEQLGDLPLGTVQINMDELVLGGQRYQSISGQMSSLPDQIAGQLSLENFTIGSSLGQIKFDAQILGSTEQSQVQVNGTIAGVIPGDLADVAILQRVPHPLTGNFEVSSTGLYLSDVYDNLAVDLELQKDPSVTGSDSGTDSFYMDVHLEGHDEQGFSAQLRSLRWGNSDASGTVRVANRADLRIVSARLRSEQVDLSELVTGRQDIMEEVSDVGLLRSAVQFTRRTVNLFGDTVRESLAGSDQEQVSANTQYFDPVSWQTTRLESLNLDIDWQARRLRTGGGQASQAHASIELHDKKLNMSFASPDTNGGVVDIQLRYDVGQTPPLAEMDALIDGLRLRPDPEAAPISGYVKMLAEGDSEAELARTLSGPVYLEAGRGKTDFVSLGAGVLTGDLVQTVFARLLPGTNTAPRLSCAVGFTQFNRGVTATPVALLISTPKNNVFVQGRLNFAKETVSAQFDSRTRTGTGLSVGNVLSSTVRLEGPLTGPKIQPNTRSLLWRYGAALATGGLTLIGESIYKRLMADRQPCVTMKQHLDKRICKVDQSLADAPMVCARKSG